MKKQSAGILIYRFKSDLLEILLVHPGGPFYLKKDLGVWSIPKGEFDLEDSLSAALREFYEETGLQLDRENLICLDKVIMKSGKEIYCWAKEQDFDTLKMKSNLFELEWPPKSGKIESFPEMDRAEWFNIETAKNKIIPIQITFIDKLLSVLNLKESQIFSSVNSKKDNRKDQQGQLELF